jgi:DNA-binding MarR family transcriptional regulator
VHSRSATNLTDKKLVYSVSGMTDGDWGELSTPALMRSARGAYAQSIRAQLHAAGITDLPRNGALILAGIDTSGGPRQDLPSELGVTKQAVSQVIDLLVNRGYLERDPDPDDRRRVRLSLTERGEDVVAAVLRGVEAVDRQLEAAVSPEKVGALRSALSALASIKQSDIATGAGRARPAGQLRRFYPIFPVTDLRAALAHYGTLGFRTFAYEDGADYGFANRDGAGLHLQVHAGHARHRPASAYLSVRDAAALSEEWSRPGIAGHTHPAEPTPWGMLEGSHTDPDGNVIRFGSPIKELAHAVAAGPARRSPRGGRGDPRGLQQRRPGRRPAPRLHPAEPGGAAAGRHRRADQDRPHLGRAGGLPGDGHGQPARADHGPWRLHGRLAARARGGAGGPA